MSTENNLEKSSQDYKKSQYGSWYKKSQQNKKTQIDKKNSSFIKKLLSLFSKKKIISKLFFKVNSVISIKLFYLVNF